MAKPKTEEILRRQKEAKQKKLLFVLAPIFLLLMVWQGPGYLKMLTGGSDDVAQDLPSPGAGLDQQPPLAPDEALRLPAGGEPPKA